MSRYRHLIITLGVVALLLATFGAAAAKENTPESPHGKGQPPAGKGKPAHLTWTLRRVTQAVTAGQTIQFTATFSSSTDIAEATLVIPGGLGRVLKANTANLTNIKAGVPTTVTFTATMPAKAHTQGGVVQVRVGQRLLAQPLSILLSVAQSNATGQDTTAKPDHPAKPAKPDHPAKPAKPIHP